jgi:hypothetical protein
MQKGEDPVEVETHNPVGFEGMVVLAADEVTAPVTPTATVDKGRPFLTHAEFIEAFARMKRGRRMVYHIGFLMHDRFLADHAKAIHGVTKHAWNLSYEGAATLAQEKIGPGVYRYFIYKPMAH